MERKPVIYPLFRILGLYLAIAVFACVSAQENDADALSAQELANARAMILEGREAIIRENLQLTAVEEAAFWPLYENYRADLLPIQDRSVTLSAGYLRRYESGTLTDEYVEKLLESYFDIRSDSLRTRKEYIRQFKKIMPMLKVARFYQLETKMHADIDAELAFLVPLIESNQ